MNEHIDPSSSSNEQAAAADGQANTVRPDATSTKTPMFQAMHAARYERQARIKDIDKSSQRKLICYVAGLAAPINSDDTLGFVDLLHHVPRGSKIDLLLHTPGGNADAAEKLISMIAETAGAGEFRVIVPDFAKSAGTLMALGADKIIMSDSSELGPIDPQVTLRDERGNMIPHSVLSYLDAYYTLSESVRNKPEDVALRIMLDKLDPTTVKTFEAARERVIAIAERHLQRAGVVKYTEIARTLMNIGEFKSHGEMIGCKKAISMELKAEYRDPKDPEWQQYWRLYCLQRLAVKPRQKLFESDPVFLPFELD